MVISSLGLSSWLHAGPTASESSRRRITFPHAQSRGYGHPFLSQFQALAAQTSSSAQVTLFGVEDKNVIHLLL